MVTLADTEENKKQYPLSESQKKKGESDFPMMRMLALISFSTGALLDLTLGPYVGKGTGETSLFLKLLKDSPESIQTGDVLLLDRLFGSFLILASLLQLRVDFVTPVMGAMNSKIKPTLRNLGKGDRLIELKRPRACDTTSDAELLGELSEKIILREVTYLVCIPGFRPKTLILLTSFLDSKLYQTKEITELYYLRWQCELDLRSIKSVLQMDQLRCKTPEMVRKEVWTHMLAYNLVRAAMVQSAVLYQIKPRTLSFKGTLQLLNAFRSVINMDRLSEEDLITHYRNFFHAIFQQKLIYRPGRIEPRAIKKKSSPYSRLKIPRSEARKRYWKKGSAFAKRKRDQATNQI